jgi:hypothetical protein
VTERDRPEGDPDAQPLTPSEDEQEPEWAQQIRELRRRRGPRLEERLTDEDADAGRPLPDL